MEAPDTAVRERANELFHAAAALPPPERHDFLESSCASDPRLLAEVRKLLDGDARGVPMLSRGLPSIAGDLMADAGPRVTEIGPYRIQGLLGRGGMGTVFLAEDTALGSLAAIKLLTHAGLSSERLERFDAEQRMLAQLNHPAIAQFHHRGSTDDGTPYFVMEYVDGAPLTDHCRERAAALDERLALFRSLCEAVQFAHQHAIIHRDIKPSNVLVKRDGTVRLLDFGIAKHLDSAGARDAQTRTDIRLMTPEYAAPEQRRGEPVGIYSDIYSLGVVLYELLCGKRPFDRSGTTDEGLAETLPARPSTTARDAAASVTASRAAWADLDVLVLTAMHPEPQRRYRSVDALIRDIDHYRRREPLEARPDTLGYRLRKFLARNRRAVTLTVATLAVVVALIAFFTVRLAVARDTAVAQARRTERIQKFMSELITGGGQDLGPAKDLRVVAVIDQGVKEAHALDADPELQTDLLQTLATLYIPLGENDSADALLREALDKRRKLYGDENAATVETMGYLGMLRAIQGRYDEAERLFTPAFEIGRRLLPPGDERVVRPTQGLASLLIRRGRFADALPIVAEVVRLASVENPLTERDLADATTLLARTHLELGHYSDAESGFERALELDRIRRGDQRASISDDLASIGSVQLERGNYPEAEKRFRESLALREQLYARDNPLVADSLTLVARVLIQEDRLADAAAALDEVLPIFQRVYPDPHPKLAAALDELGQLARKRGRLDDAEALHRRVEDIVRAVFGDKHHRLAVAHGHLGEVFLERNDLAAAEQTFRESLAMLGETLPPGHPRTAAAQARLGRAVLRQHRSLEAEPLLRSACEVLSQLTTRADPWHSAACDDLVALYEALGEPAKAAAFRNR